MKKIILWTLFLFICAVGTANATSSHPYDQQSKSLKSATSGSRQ